MKDVDELTDRLHELGQRAPFPAADPSHDIHRGRTALRRRRRTRGAVGVTAALVAVGLAATSLPALNWFGSGDTVVVPAGGPSKTTVPSPTSSSTKATKSVSAPKATSKPSAHSKNLCKIDPSKFLPPANKDGSVVIHGKKNIARINYLFNPISPAQAAADNATVTAYHEAAAKILDPSGKHLAAFDNGKQDTGNSGSFTCDPKTGEHPAILDDKIGWKSGGQLGVVEIDVSVPKDNEQPQVAFNYTGWTAYNGPLPAGIAKAKVVNYSYGGQQGHAIWVHRTDGITVAIDSDPFWGNNDAPGSPAATDLPGVQKLLELAASPMLTAPQYVNH